MSAKPLNILCVGDIILGNDAAAYFEHVGPTLKEMDLVIGHLEVPYTNRHPQAVELERDPENLRPLVTFGFDVLTLAGNHLADAGSEGIIDTIRWLKENQLHYVGAGLNEEEAFRPLIVTRAGTRVGILKYNCVGPEETWATPHKPGGAYVKVLTHYELQHANPGGPPSIYTFADPRSRQKMEDAIRSLRSQCDILIVSFHKGLVHQPVKIADYEKELSHAAIDAGADLIIGEHAHLLKGIEFYKGKPIFHGLCNFIAYVPSLFPKPGEDPQAWSQKRMELFGFVPDPDYPTYPFHPEAIYTMMAKVVVENGKIKQAGFIPCIVNKEGKPVVVGRENGGQQVVDYVRAITEKAGFNTHFTWREDEVIVEDGR